MAAKWFLLEASVITISVGCSSLGTPSYTDPTMVGDPAPVSAATRTLFVTADTKYVNVTGGEIVRFVVNDKAFAWNFDGTGYTPPFDLSAIAPPGVLDHPVTVYAAPNPMYLGGDGGGHHGGHGGHGGGGHGGGGHGGK